MGNDRSEADNGGNGNTKDFPVHKSERAALLGLYTQAKSKHASTEPLTPSKAKVVLVHGHPGVGRTTLVQKTLQNTVLNDDQGIWIHIAFDTFPDPDPFYAVTEALWEWVYMVLDSQKTRLEIIKSMIINEIGEDLRELLDLIPPMKRLFDSGKEDSLNEGNSSLTLRTKESTISAALIHRYTYLFKSLLVGLCSTPSIPVVLLLDDLDFANFVTLDLLSSIAQQASVRAPFLIVATYEMESQIQKFVTLWNGDEDTMSRIGLDELNEPDTNELAKEAIWQNTPSDQWKSVSDQDYFGATKGNLFFLFLLSNVWSFARDDPTKEEEQQTCKTPLLNSEGYVTSQLSTLPYGAQEMLRAAACIGSRLNNYILQYLVDDMSLLEEYLNQATDAKLLVDSCCDTFAFSHTCIYKTIHATIPVSQLSIYNRNIGRKLWKGFSLEELDEYIFLVVELLLRGKDSIQSDKEQYAVAKLCLRAGEKAATACSFRSANFYLMNGIALQPDTRWTDEYRLCLDLFAGAAEVAYSMGSMDDVDRLVDEVLKNVKEPKDLHRIQLIKLYMLGSKSRTLEAIEFGCSLLVGLGITLPESPTLAGCFFALRRISRRLRKKSDEMILRLPFMENPEKLAAMQVLSHLIMVASLAKRELAPFIAEAMVTLTLDYGLSALSSLGFVLYGQILCSRLIDLERGYQVGLLAIAIQRKFPVSAFLGRVQLLFYSCIFGVKHPFRESVPHLDHSRRLSLQLGDTESASLCSNSFYLCQLDTTPIPILATTVVRLQNVMELHGQELNLLLAQPSIIIWLNLSNRDDGDFKRLRNVAFDQSSFESLKEGFLALYLWYHYATMLVRYLFGDYEAAFEHSQHCEPLLSNHSAFGDFSVVSYYSGLTCVAMARKDKSRSSHLIRKANRCLKHLRLWAAHAPSNFLGKTFLLEAELLAFRGKHEDAYQKYTCAISLSRDGGFFLVSALAHEKMGRWRESQNMKAEAIKHLEQASKVYSEFGADAKVAHLQKDIEKLYADPSYKTVISFI
uniref:Orc1-like AAA ATPase domain-containing protein n=1 Tax=Entomoneis paludosa TaxID=265537 RepID=A0A7S3DRA2_9STRA|mmetsp:Transcript_30907/g.64506  ORF Transcript_30907/g.64506 Transcript_30907/m.64506 type:complete len:1023 (+) Transcript_30907:45-3113(+)